MWRILRQHDFALAWSGGLISMLGSWALGIALPIHVYELTGSSLATGGVIAAYIAPGIAVGSIAGVYVDRWDRKHTMIASNLLLAAGTVPIAAVQDESTLWLVYPLAVLLGTLSQFTDAAENAFLPRLVAEDDLVVANSLNALNNSLARLGGPALGGALYATTGIAGVAMADAASYAAAAGLLALVHASGAIAPREGEGEAATATGRWRRVWHEWRDGLGLVRRAREVRAVFGVTALTAFGEGVFGVMFVIWVHDVLEGGAPELGSLQSAQAVGGLLGGVVGAYAGRRLLPERLYGVALLCFGVLDLALFNYPLALEGVALGIGIMILVGIPSVSIQAARATILQTHVEDAYRGRIFGSLATSAALLALIGTTAAGLTGDLAGPIALLNLQGAGYVVSGIFVLLALAPAGTDEMRRPHPSYR